MANGFFTYTGFYDIWDITSAGGVIYLYAIDFDMTRKSLLLAQVTVAIGLALSFGTGISQPSNAQSDNVTFYCGTSNGVPATIARTPRGDIPIIIWRSDYFSEAGFSPVVRCQQVSSRFQTYYNEGNLNYITIGRMNGFNVVCAARTLNGLCSGLLFTLKPGSSPVRALQALGNVRNLNLGSLSESNRLPYINVNELLISGGDNVTERRLPRAF